MASILVRVTQKHINEGRRKNSAECPIALACSMTVGRKVSVGCHFFHFDDCLVTRIPKQIREKIETFDDRGWMEPFEFSLEIPEISK